MRGGGGKKTRPRRTRSGIERPIPLPSPSRQPPPIPLEPVDLLAGLAPGVDLHADRLPPGIDAQAPSEGPTRLTVAEAGKLIRAGDSTVRRLIRTTVLTPVDSKRARRVADVDRAGVPPRSSDKPGE